MVWSQLSVECRGVFRFLTDSGGSRSHCKRAPVSTAPVSHSSTIGSNSMAGTDPLPEYASGVLTRSS